MISKDSAGLRIRFYIISTLLVVFWLLPLVIAGFTAMKTMDEFMSNPYMWAPPERWTLENFSTVWTRVGMWRYMLNTVFISSMSVAGTLFVSSLSAFALSFYTFRMNKPILFLFVAGMLLPFQMLMIPVFRFSDAVGLLNTYQGIILFHVAFQIGFCTFFLCNFMKTVPFSLFEAAKIDGANDLYIYGKIMMPLSLPALAALGVLEFTWIWNDLLWSLILLQSDRLKPITLGLANMQGQYITQYNLMAAGSILAASVPLIVFLMFQRYFIEGLTVGAEKG